MEAAISVVFDGHGVVLVQTFAAAQQQPQLPLQIGTLRHQHPPLHEFYLLDIIRNAAKLPELLREPSFLWRLSYGP
jgi:hypothetical protein